MIAATGLWSSLQAQQLDSTPPLATNSDKEAEEIEDDLSPPRLLEPLTIHALRSSLFEASSQLQTTVIDSDELTRNRWQNLGDLLGSQSGLTFSQSGGPGQQGSLFVRGLDNKHTLLLVDGFRLDDPSVIAGEVFWNHQNLGGADRVEVVRGPQSILWGSGAAGGVINLSRKTPQEGAHGRVHATNGSFNSQHAGASVSYSEDGLMLEAGFNQKNAEGFSAAAPTKSAPDYGHDPESLGFAPDGYRMESHRLKGAYTAKNGLRLTLQRLALSGWSQYDASAGTDANNTQSSDTILTGATLDQDLSHGRWQIFMQKSDFKRRIDTAMGSGQYDAKTLRSGFDGEWHYRPGMALFINAEQNENSLGTSYTTDVDRSHTARSLLVAHGASFFEDRGMLTVGLRQNSHSGFEDQTTGQISLNLKAQEWLFFAGHSTAYKAPSLYQLYAPATNWGPVGNSELKPESIRTSEIGAGWGNRLKATLFENRITDLIDYGNGYENLAGTSTIQGVELAFSQSLNDNPWGFSFNHTHFLKAEDASGDRLARRPRNQSTAHLDYAPIRSLNLRLSGEYIGDRIESDETQTGKYTLAHLVANWQLSDEATLFGRIENLTDRYYQVVDGYQSAPRSGYVGLEAKF
jgi:vitamin B12 transporter